MVIAALRKGLLGKQEAKDTVYALVFKGFRIEPKLLARIIETIEKENAE